MFEKHGFTNKLNDDSVKNSRNVSPEIKQASVTQTQIGVDPLNDANQNSANKRDSNVEGRKTVQQVINTGRDTSNAMTHDEIQISLENDASEDSLNSITEFENDENLTSQVTSNIIPTQNDLRGSGSIPPSSPNDPPLKSCPESEITDGQGFVLNLV